MGLFRRTKTHEPKFEYKTLKVSGTLRTGGGFTKAVDKAINEMARQGWEFVNAEEMGRGKNNNRFFTTSLFGSTRYVMLTFKREV